MIGENRRQPIVEMAFEPAEHPTASDCRDAIQKGLGRALLWARKGAFTDKDTLLAACLNDQRYDRPMDFDTMVKAIEEALAS